MVGVYRGQHVYPFGSGIVCFFFQAEDGIRDHCVTEFRRVLFRSPTHALSLVFENRFLAASGRFWQSWFGLLLFCVGLLRSEERSVGKESRSQWVMERSKLNNWVEI